MPSISQSLGFVSNTDKEFIGTVTFRNEKLSLPDGSKVAIGIDDGMWVIVFQEANKQPFIVYEYNSSKNTILVDKKVGGQQEIERVVGIVKYFFEQADVDDVVTIEPGSAQQ